MKKTFLVVLLLVLGMAPARAEDASAVANYFVAPKEWVLMPPGQSGMTAFHTQEDRNNSLYVLVRPVNAPGQSPMKWAEDEIAVLKKQGSQILIGPSEEARPSVKFVKIVSMSYIAEIRVRTEQYFTQAPDQKGLIEVAVMGPPEFFGPEHGRIEAFLDSFRL